MRNSHIGMVSQGGGDTDVWEDAITCAASGLFLRSITHLFKYPVHFYDAHDTVEQNSSKKKKSFRDLFPGLTEDQLREAEENLCHYVEICLQIYQGMESDSADLDRSNSSSKMKERSNASLKT